MQIKMSSAISFNLDQSEILSSGNGFKKGSSLVTMTQSTAFILDILTEAAV